MGAMPRKSNFSPEVRERAVTDQRRRDAGGGKLCVGSRRQPSDFLNAAGVMASSGRANTSR
jgi:hypothetical protein